MFSIFTELQKDEVILTILLHTRGSFLPLLYKGNDPCHRQLLKARKEELLASVLRIDYEAAPHQTLNLLHIS